MHIYAVFLPNLIAKYRHFLQKLNRSGIDLGRNFDIYSGPVWARPGPENFQPVVISSVSLSHLTQGHLGISRKPCLTAVVISMRVASAYVSHCLIVLCKNQYIVIAILFQRSASSIGTERHSTPYLQVIMEEYSTITYVI